MRSRDGKRRGREKTWTGKDVTGDEVGASKLAPTNQEPRTTTNLKTSFASKLIRWQREYGRHDLPWQNTRDAYRIWLSEIMLQQTQVATVIPYYHRFLARFPDLATLAQAPLDAVLECWSGLGYYSRGRNLHRAAQIIATDHGGDFPRDYDAIVALPGIGRSTAAAICVFAYAGRRAILEGNVKRVLARCLGIRGYPGEARVQAQLWDAATRLLPANRIEAYTQGLMDLGTAVCVRTSPRCGVCPLADICVARRQGTVGLIPAPRPRTVQPQRRTQMLVLLHAGDVLLEKRAESGVWGGLWSLPERVSDLDMATWCAQTYGAEVAVSEALPAIAHTFTHFKLDIEPWKLVVSRIEPRAAAPGTVWLPVAQALGAAIPAPVRKILAAL